MLTKADQPTDSRQMVIDLTATDTDTTFTPGYPSGPCVVVINQTDLALLAAEEDVVEKLQAQLLAAQAVTEQHRLDILLRFQAGAVLEVGPLSAHVETPKGRSSPKWKEEFCDHMTSEHQLAREVVEEDMRKKYPAKPGTPTLVLDRK